MIHIISGAVIHGEWRGAPAWFPTANISLNSQEIPDSVFQINIIIDSILYSWIGTYQKEKWVFESHIFNFSEDIYEKNISIYLLEEIRKNRKFDSLDSLKKQISTDVQKVKNNSVIVLTFGSFDVVHKWHEYYLSEARKYGTKLITIIASDNNIERIKWNPPLHSSGKRTEAIEQLWISNEAIVWSESNPMKWLKKYRPDVICLGYDQRWPFVEELPQELKKLWLRTEIIRITSLCPEKFKSSILKKKNIL